MHVLVIKGALNLGGAQSVSEMLCKHVHTPLGRRGLGQWAWPALLGPGTGRLEVLLGRGRD